MNILKALRGPYLSLFLASLILFVSCEQHDSVDSEKQNFDYSLFNEFKSSSIKLDLSSIQSNTSSSSSQFDELITLVNSNLGTDLELPQKALNMINQDSETIFTQSLANGWLNEKEINSANNLIFDIQSLGFEAAILNYEQEILDQNLSEQEFLKQNRIVNILKSQNFENPRLYNLQSQNTDLANRVMCDWCKCAAASVALVVATAGLTSCATIAACGLAVVLVYAASNGFASACLEE